MIGDMKFHGHRDDRRGRRRSLARRVPRVRPRRQHGRGRPRARLRDRRPGRAHGVRAVTPIANCWPNSRGATSGSSLDGDLLRVDAPKDAVTAELRATLLARKAELVAHFRGAHAAPSGLQPARIDDRDEPERVSPGPAAHPGARARARRGSGLQRADRLPPRRPARRRGARAEPRRPRASARGAAHRLRRERRATVPARAPAVGAEDATSTTSRRLSPGWTGPRANGRSSSARPRRCGDRSISSAGPLWRARLLRTDPDAHVLVLTMHHVVFDGRSKPIYLAEAGELYRARVAGVRAFAARRCRPPYARLRPLAAAGRERRQRGGPARPLAARARRGLRAGPSFRSIAPGPPRGAWRRQRAFAVSGATARALRGLSRQEQASPYITLLAAFCALLHGRTGQDDLLVCSPFAVARSRGVRGH